MLNHKIIIFFIGLFIILFFTLSTAQAANLGEAFKGNLGSAATLAGYDPSANTPVIIISAVVNVALSVLGVIFLFLIIYGGYMWMTARGNEQQVEKAKNTIQTAIIGLIIVLSAYAISWYVIGRMSAGIIKEEQTTSPPNPSPAQWDPEAPPPLQ